MDEAVNLYQTSSSGAPTQSPTPTQEFVALATVPGVAPAQAAPGAAGIRVVAAAQLSLIGCANASLLNWRIAITSTIKQRRGPTHESKVSFVGTVFFQGFQIFSDEKVIKNRLLAQR